MKNFKIIVICIFCFLLIISGCDCKEKQSIRLRILAEDDTISSQEEKTQVLEILKQLFDEEILTYNTLSVEVVKKELKERLPLALYQKLTISFTTSLFPAKSYHGTFIPSGTYETFLIQIGCGKGHNFWTILYPEYFGVEFEESNEIEYHSYFYDLFLEGVNNENLFRIRPCRLNIKK